MSDSSNSARGDSAKLRNDSPTWPVIISQSLVGSEISNILHRQVKLKARVSKNILDGTCIFPMSGVTFMILELDKASENTATEVNSHGLKQVVTDRIDNLIKLHHNCYLICLGDMAEQQPSKNFFTVQARYLKTALHLVPVCSSKEAVQCMDTIVKVTCKPCSTIVRQRLEKMLQTFISKNTLRDFLQTIGLDTHERLLLQDGLGSLAQIVSSTEADFLDCCLDYNTIRQFMRILRHK